jgi:hypothetical protein
VKAYRGTTLAVLLASIGFVLAAVGVGCGGSDDPAPLTRSEFVKQANEICSSAESERKQESEDLGSAEEGDQATEQEAVAAALVSPVESMVEDLDGLGPPKGDEKQVEAIVVAFEAGIDRLEAEPVGAGAVAAFSKANGLALEYGLTDCTI